MSQPLPVTTNLNIDSVSYSRNNIFKNQKSDENEFLGIWLCYHAILYISAIFHTIKLFANFTEEFFTKVLFFRFVQGPGILHFSLRQQIGLILLNNEKQMLFNLTNPGSQIRLKEVLDPFHLQAHHIEIESFIAH